jgi:hypothetical protein
LTTSHELARLAQPPPVTLLVHASRSERHPKGF